MGVQPKGVNYNVIAVSIILVSSMRALITYMIVIGLIERKKQEFMVQARLIA